MVVQVDRRELTRRKRNNSLPNELSAGRGWSPEPRAERRFASLADARIRFIRWSADATGVFRPYAHVIEVNAGPQAGQRERRGGVARVDDGNVSASDSRSDFNDIRRDGSYGRRPEELDGPGWQARAAPTQEPGRRGG